MPLARQWREGKRITARWSAIGELRQDSRAQVLENVRFVRDGILIHSAGVSAGIDMALWMIGELAEDPLAERTVRRMLEYYPAVSDDTGGKWMLSIDQKAAGFVVDNATHTIRFVRDLHSPPARAFGAWTEPGQLVQWWDATGEKLAACEIDLRPGGAFRFVTRHHPEKPFAGVYREIVPAELLIFEANGATGKVVLAEQAGGTRMTVEIACPTAAHLAQFLEAGIAAGTSRTLDNLARHLG